MSVGKIDDQADLFSWNGLRMHASTYAKFLKLKNQASRLFDEFQTKKFFTQAHIYPEVSKRHRPPNFGRLFYVDT